MTAMPINVVRVNVPTEISTIVDAEGHSHLVHVDETGQRFANIPAVTARQLMNSGLACAEPWRAVNAALSEALGRLPKPEPGIHIAGYFNAVEALRPPHPRDVGATLRDFRGLR